MHEIPTHTRKPLLYHLSSKDTAWTLTLVTTDSQAKVYVQKRIIFPKQSREVDEQN